MRVLVVNAGSTSLKLHVVDGEDATTVAELSDARGVDAVAHRVVHGGELRRPLVVDDEVERALADATELAPLHNAPALRALRDARAALPDVPHVAVFDSGFHETLPEAAATYAVPREWGVRRFGFHGLSVAWAVERAAARRVVVCHLGGGSSVTGVVDGRSVDTTMGFTPLDGVPMTTRSGALDPGVLVHALRTQELSVDELDRQLAHESGLRALSGTSGDVRELGEGLALDVYTLRVAGAVAAMTASTGPLDALVFTAGIGENAPRVRSLVCSRLDAIGVELDEDANERAVPDCDVASPGSRVRVLVVRAREELVAARLARDAVAAREPS